jgi:predicted esterase
MKITLLMLIGVGVVLMNFAVEKLAPVEVKVTKMKSLPMGYKFKEKEHEKRDWVVVELTASNEVLRDDIQLKCLWFASRARPNDKNKTRTFLDREADRQFDFSAESEWIIDNKGQGLKVPEKWKGKQLWYVPIPVMEEDLERGTVKDYRGLFLLEYQGKPLVHEGYPGKMVLDNLEFLGKNDWIELMSKSLAEGTAGDKINGFVEHVVQTGNIVMPQITLFLKTPMGQTNFKKVKGVLAICVLANNVQKIRDGLVKNVINTETDVMTKYANERDLAVLIWGCRTLWDKEHNWYDVPEVEYKVYDKNMDEVSAAWVRGANELLSKYDVKPTRFLLDGYSGGAQFALRLALRHPEQFLAVHGHVPGSCDFPIDNGKGTLWLLTTGENDFGKLNMAKFYTSMRKREAPVIFKVYPNAEHNRSLAAVRLTKQFFDYALKYEKHEKAKLGESLELDKAEQFPWYTDYNKSLFYGDWFLNSRYKEEEGELGKLLKNRRVPLPTRELAEAWMVNEVVDDKVGK